MAFFQLTKFFFPNLTVRSFFSFIGVDENTLECLWNMIRKKVQEKIYLLWTLSFLKNGFSFDVGALIWKVSKENFREKFWLTVNSLNELHLLGEMKLRRKSAYFFIVDVTECKIRRPSGDLQKIFYSGQVFLIFQN